MRKSGRRLVLTEMGRLVYGYADEIFSAGREMVEAVRGRPTGRPMRLVVGVADVVQKLVAQRLIEPALRLPEPVQVVCREASPEQLLDALARHTARPARSPTRPSARRSRCAPSTTSWGRAG